MGSRSGLAFIFASILATVTAQVLLKYGVGQVERLSLEGGEWSRFLVRALFHPAVVCGLACSVVGALCWLGALSRCNLSFAYPFMGLAIVSVLVITPTLFGEQVSMRQWCGVVVVCLGIWISSSAAAHP